MTQYTLQFADQPVTTLAAGITAASPSLQVLSGSGALFPNLVPTSSIGVPAFVATLFKNGNTSIWETVLVTGRAGDNFTGLIRNWEPNGVGALAWNAGDTIAMVPTAGTMGVFGQLPDIQSQRFNYAADTGSANAYAVNLGPALNASNIGMPIVWKAQHSNTGSSTFNDGIRTAPLLTSQGDALVAGDITAGGIYVSVWDGTNFQVTTVQRTNFSRLAGQILTSQVPQNAVVQWEAALAIAFAQLTGQLQNGQIASSLVLPGSPTTTTQAVNDSSTKIATTAFVNPDLTVNSNGTMFKRPDGGYEAYGVATNVGNPSTITLPKPFPNGFNGVIATPINSTNQINSGTPPSTGSPVASFQLKGGSGSTEVFWHAFGY